MNYRERLELRKLYEKAWPYAPAVREMHWRRVLRYDRMQRYYKRMQRYWESKTVK